MLTEQSYQLAWGVYLAAALGFLLLVRYYLAAILSPGAMVTLLLVLAALVFTPATASEDAETIAPAVLVALFDLLTILAIQAPDDPPP